MAKTKAKAGTKTKAGAKAKAAAKTKAKAGAKTKAKAAAKTSPSKKAAAKPAKRKTVAKLKTAATSGSVDGFLAGLDAKRRAECTELVGLMRKATGAAPKMWGTSIVGFGEHHYKYESGREGDFFVVGFSPRKAALTLYFSSGFAELTDLLARLGKHDTGKGCLYVKALDDVDRGVLAKLIDRGVESLRARA